DRLGPAKELAQIGAALGREFSHPLLAAMVHKPEAELRSMHAISRRQIVRGAAAAAAATRLGTPSVHAQKDRQTLRLRTARGNEDSRSCVDDWHAYPQSRLSGVRHLIRHG